MEINKYNYTNFLKFIKTPLINEKSMFLFNKESKHTLLVNIKLKKDEIKFILEKVFNCQITKINTIILPKKIKTINNKKGTIIQYKKVYIQLKNKKKLENFYI